MAEKQRQMCLEEIALLQKVRHECVAQLVDLVWTSKDMLSYWIVLKFYPGGDVQNEIDDCRENDLELPLGKAKNWVTQLCMALKHVHSLRIVHRDVKGSNMFITGARNIVLGDFGVSKQLTESQQKAMTSVGSPMYMAPEWWDGRGGTAASDMWSVGVVLYELLALRRPFEAQNVLSLVHKITTEEPAALDEDTDQQLATLAMRLLQKRPESRPSATDALGFPGLEDVEKILGIYRGALEKKSDKQQRKKAREEDAAAGKKPRRPSRSSSSELDSSGSTGLAGLRGVNLADIARRQAVTPVPAVAEGPMESDDEEEDEDEKDSSLGSGSSEEGLSDSGDDLAQEIERQAETLGNVPCLRSDRCLDWNLEQRAMEKRVSVAIHGLSGRCLQLEVKQEDTIGRVKQLLGAAWQVTALCLQLSLDSHLLDDVETLCSVASSGQLVDLAAVYLPERLYESLESGKLLVKRAALVALPAVASPGDRRAIRAALNALEIPVPELHLAAIDALVTLGRGRPHIIAEIAALVTDAGTALVKCHALSKLGDVAERGDGHAFDAVLAGLSSPDDDVRRKALDCALPALVDPGDPSAISKLATLLRHRDRHVRETAVEALAVATASSAEGRKSAVYACASLLDSNDWVARQFALKAMASVADVGDDDAAAIAISCLQDADRDIRCQSIEILPKIVPKGDVQALLSMAACLDDDDADVQAAAVRYFPHLAEPGCGVVLDAMIGRLASSEGRVRHSATRLLPCLAQQGDAASIGALLARLRDVEVPIRVSAVQSIAAIMQSPSDLQTLRVLVGSLEDEHRAVRWAVMNALLGMDAVLDGKAVHTLRERLDDGCFDDAWPQILVTQLAPSDVQEQVLPSTGSIPDHEGVAASAANTDFKFKPVERADLRPEGAADTLSYSQTVGTMTQTGTQGEHMLLTDSLRSLQCTQGGAVSEVTCFAAAAGPASCVRDEKVGEATALPEDTCRQAGKKQEQVGEVTSFPSSQPSGLKAQAVEEATCFPSPPAISIASKDVGSKTGNEVQSERLPAGSRQMAPDASSGSESWTGACPLHASSDLEGNAGLGQPSPADGVEQSFCSQVPSRSPEQSETDEESSEEEDEEEDEEQATQDEEEEDPQHDDGMEEAEEDEEENAEEDTEEDEAIEEAIVVAESATSPAGVEEDPLAAREGPETDLKVQEVMCGSRPTFSTAPPLQVEDDSDTPGANAQGKSARVTFGYQAAGRVGWEAGHERTLPRPGSQESRCYTSFTRTGSGARSEGGRSTPETTGSDWIRRTTLAAMSGALRTASSSSSLQRADTPEPALSTFSVPPREPRFPSGRAKVVSATVYSYPFAKRPNNDLHMARSTESSGNASPKISEQTSATLAGAARPEKRFATVTGSPERAAVKMDYATRARSVGVETFSTVERPESMGRSVTGRPSRQPVAGAGKLTSCGGQSWRTGFNASAKRRLVDWLTFPALVYCLQEKLRLHALCVQPPSLLTDRAGMLAAVRASGRHDLKAQQR
ncbi:Nek1 [Symbiodinium natans]|uniref:non-specific serine/threonine protein kinase n=1 Tax=Symbiodinium natans TaxID=878477 RepID=A0A812MAH0_9DINO|nr:Nek1 [Symbiodinium natans]